MFPRIFYRVQERVTCELRHLGRQLSCQHCLLAGQGHLQQRHELAVVDDLVECASVLVDPVLRAGDCSRDDLLDFVRQKAVRLDIRCLPLVQTPEDSDPRDWAQLNWPSKSKYTHQ